MFMFILPFIVCFPNIWTNCMMLWQLLNLSLCINDNRVKTLYFLELIVVYLITNYILWFILFHWALLKSAYIYPIDFISTCHTHGRIFNQAKWAADFDYCKFIREFVWRTISTEGPELLPNVVAVSLRGVVF